MLVIILSVINLFFCMALDEENEEEVEDVTGSDADFDDEEASA